MDAEQEFNSALLALKTLYETSRSSDYIKKSEIDHLQTQLITHVKNIISIYANTSNLVYNSYLEIPYIDSTPEDEYLNAWDFLSDLYFDWRDGAISTFEGIDLFNKILAHTRNMVSLNRMNSLPLNQEDFKKINGPVACNNEKYE